MINAERLARIMDMMRPTGFVSIREIMDAFAVSRSSAMRDLDELQAQGKVIRQRGGAILKEKAALLTSLNEAPVRQREVPNPEGRRKICALAAQTIPDKACLYLDGGNTVAGLVEGLKNRQVTLVTPNLWLLSQLGPDFPGKVFVLGGEVRPGYDMTYGPLARQQLGQFHFDVCYISCNGLDPEDQECTAFDFGIADVKQEAMRRSTQKVLLCDRTKLEHKGMCRVAGLEEFDRIYVDGWPEGMDVPGNVTMTE